MELTLALIPIILTEFWSASSRQDRHEFHRIAGSTGCSTWWLLIGGMWPAVGDIGGISNPAATPSNFLYPVDWPVQCRATGEQEISWNDCQSQEIMNR